MCEVMLSNSVMKIVEKYVTDLEKLFKIVERFSNSVKLRKLCRTNLHI